MATLSFPTIAELGEARYVEVGGRRVRYLETGHGEPMLLVHGWLGSAENFHKWVPALAERRRMIMPDLPGFGETPELEGPTTIAGLAEFMLDFADAIGIKLFDLGGLCLGATVALEMAKRQPMRVRQMVLHTPIYSRGSVSRRFTTQTGVLLNPVVFPLASRFIGSRRLSDLYKRFFIEGDDVDDIDALVNFENQRRCSMRAARGWMLDALRQDYEPWLTTWEQPTLMIVAGGDWLLRPDRLQQMTERMQTAEVVVVPEATHGWNEALVRAQAAAISGFLSPEAI